MPQIVIGAVLIYILSSQIAAGFTVVFEKVERFSYEDGLVIGASILMATVVAFLSPEVLGSFPSVLQPILSNAFAVGVIVALVLEHGIFKK